MISIAELFGILEAHANVWVEKPMISQGERMPSVWTWLTKNENMRVGYPEFHHSKSEKDLWEEALIAMSIEDDRLQELGFSMNTKFGRSTKIEGKPEFVEVRSQAWSDLQKTGMNARLTQDFTFFSEHIPRWNMGMKEWEEFNEDPGLCSTPMNRIALNEAEREIYKKYLEELNE